MIKKIDKNAARKVRHRRVRNKISGTGEATPQRFPAVLNTSMSSLSMIIWDIP